MITTAPLEVTEITCAVQIFLDFTYAVRVEI